MTIIHFNELGTAWRGLDNTDPALLTNTALTLDGKPRNQLLGTPPEHNPLTHQAIRGIDGWSLRERSQEETAALTAAKQAAEADAAEKDELRKAVDKLDAIIAAQSMTSAQFLEACKLFARGFKRIIKDHYQG